MLRKITFIITGLAVLLGTVGGAWAQDGSSHKGGLVSDLIKQLADPLFWFGLTAQGLFFARFFIQWLISEKHKRSTVPVAFWYFSLAGAVCWFIYGLLRRDLAIMLGAVLSCFFYVRNLMLIRSQHLARRQTVQPTEANECNADAEVL